LGEQNGGQGTHLPVGASQPGFSHTQPGMQSMSPAHGAGLPKPSPGMPPEVEKPPPPTLGSNASLPAAAPPLLEPALVVPLTLPPLPASAVEPAALGVPAVPATAGGSSNTDSSRPSQPIAQESVANSNACSETALMARRPLWKSDARRRP
jgi:hypothetical protein